VTLRIVDLRDKTEQEETFHFKGGLVEFVKYIDSTRPSIMRKVFYARGSDKDENGRAVEVEVAFQYNDQYSENIFTYVNNINTHEGGSHLVGFRTALTRTLNSYGYKNGIIKEGKIQLTGDDFKEGFTGILSVKVPEPQFEGQTKTKLARSRALWRVWLAPRSQHGSTRTPAMPSGHWTNRCGQPRPARQRAKRAILLVARMH
jgi:DNA gyrase subunit B